MNDQITRARRLMLPAVAALTMAAFALPAAADAAVLTEPAGSDRYTLLTGPGETNKVRVADDGPGFIRVSDQLPLAEDTSGCQSVSRTELRCPAQPTRSLTLLLGAGADRAEIATTRRVTVEGGSGSDTYAGGLTAGSSQVVFRGGPDKDLADYHDATQAVIVKLGNGPGDGRPADNDDIADAEHVIGSRFGDGLEAHPDLGAELDGGMGVDILTGSALRDVLVSGAGGDFLASRGGADRVVASDADRDTVDCGTGTPDEALVSIAGERTISGCERVIPVRGGATTTGPSPAAAAFAR
jgi:hypothetical protein